MNEPVQSMRKWRLLNERNVREAQLDIGTGLYRFRV
jgi:hypothetical protein